MLIIQCPTCEQVINKKYDGKIKCLSCSDVFELEDAKCIDLATARRKYSELRNLHLVEQENKFAAIKPATKRSNVVENGRKEFEYMMNKIKGEKI